jgi:hypothetical protein
VQADRALVCLQHSGSAQRRLQRLVNAPHRCEQLAPGLRIWSFEPERRKARVKAPRPIDDHLQPLGGVQVVDADDTLDPLARENQLGERRQQRSARTRLPRRRSPQHECLVVIVLATTLDACFQGCRGELRGTIGLEAGAAVVEIHSGRSVDTIDATG